MSEDKNKRNFDSFREMIDHELPLETIKLEQEGFKIDGDTKSSLKSYCNFCDLKSADYFISRSKKTYVVEFSDILDQEHKTIQKIEEIKKCNISPAHKKTICEGYFRTVVQEMKEKFKDTDVIYKSLSKHFDDLDEEFHNTYEKCILVYSDKRLNHPDIPRVKQVALNKFLATLAARITNSMPSYLNTTVIIAPISKFSE
ncbi:hypothetical protein NI380_18745 [Vibrio parahaemolyticus]|uniref:hypothetical protein n=1 Tax=Vibrio parahaemolyticus TaxID=670 RepID=UPI00111F44A4|nr:hypothetical protein [Vibrio parahaemolyticus]WMN98952.1 hypothetical protein NI380_18745 [Vibrio parahaemolyticus]